MEDDLTWLARNVHQWPENMKALLKPARFVLDVMPLEEHFTRDQWLARRAELQNKPSWKDAPEWANWLAQWNDGAWFWCGDEIDNPPQKGEQGWYQDGEALHLPTGEILGDWRDTLEKRPEHYRAEMEVELVKAAFQPFTSIEDNQELNVSNKQEVELAKAEFEPFVSMEDGASQAGTDAIVAELIRRLEEHPEKFGAERLAILSSVADAELTKRDAAVCGGDGYLNDHWFELGQLPPVGARCEALITSERQWVEIEVICHRDGFALGWCPEERCGYHGDEPTDFRPIHTERDRLAEQMMKDSLALPCETTESIMLNLYDAGYRKQK